MRKSTVVILKQLNIKKNKIKKKNYEKNTKMKNRRRQFWKKNTKK
jgi:hypothetical protein